MKNRLIAALLALGFGVLLAGCNTVAGIGKDMERAGEKVQEAVKK